MRIPYSASGYVVNSVTVPSNKSLVGEGRVKLISTASYCLRIQSTSVSILYQTTVSDLTIDMTGASSGSTAILLATSLGVVFGVRLSKLHFTNCYTAIQDESHASNYSVDVFAQDCNCTYTRGRQVYLRRSRGFITFRDFRIDHTYNTGQVTWGGAEFLDFIGLELEKFDVVGPVIPTSTYQSGSIGLKLTGTGSGKASVWLRRVLVDNTRGPGVAITDVFNLYSVDTCIYQNLGSALDLNTVTDSNFVNTVIKGGKGLTGVPAGGNGLTLTSCARVHFSNTTVSGNTGQGVVLNNTTDCTFTGGSIRDNGAYGMYQLGTSDKNVLVGLHMSSHSSNNLVQVGSNSACLSWINGSTYRASDTGAVTV